MNESLRFVADPKGFPSFVYFNTISEIVEAIEASRRYESTLLCYRRFTFSLKIDIQSITQSFFEG